MMNAVYRRYSTLLDILALSLGYVAGRATLIRHPHFRPRRPGRLWGLVRSPLRCIGLCSAGIFLISAAEGQWVTQPVPLVPGWNSVYLYVQPEPRTLSTIFTNVPVDEVRKWDRSGASVEFVVDPGNPPPRPGYWQHWFRPGSTEEVLSTFGHLLANEAYYIHVETNASAFTLNLKGVPVLNSYTWPRGSYSLYGLPVPAAPPRTFTEFFSATEDIPTASGALSRIYSVSPLGNEYPVFRPTIETIVRGEAYWILANDLSSYAGPIRVMVDGQPSGMLDFQARLEPRTLSIRNTNTSASRRVVVSQLASESAPAGVGDDVEDLYPAVAGSVPLSYGVMNWDPDNLGIDYLPMPAILTRSLAPGALLELSIRPDPSALEDPAPNAVYQSVLTVHDLDEQNRTFVEQSVGVRFEAAPQATGDPEGLWVGDVWVTGVNRARIGGFATNWNTEVVSPVGRALRFRVILEVDSSRQATLLQQAFVAWLPVEQESIAGLDGSYLGGTNVVLYSMDEANDFVATHPDASVSRISAVNFPFMEPLALGGTFGGTTAGSFSMAFDDPVNPFMHLYSPGHDNKEYRNSVAIPLGAGVESYDITRTVTFAFSDTDASGTRPPDWGISQWGGTYTESIEGLLTPGALIRTEGLFLLQKMSGP